MLGPQRGQIHVRTVPRADQQYKRRLDLSNHLVNENKCSGGHVAWAPRVSTSTEAR